MNTASVECLADYACDTGENPLYHPGENRVYWTDIPQGQLFRYDIATGTHEVCYRGEPVGGFTRQGDGSLLLFMARGAIKTWQNGTIRATVAEEIPDERESRFNDVFADPDGRVFCGTMPTPERPGRLYRLDTDGSLTVVLEGVGCSNGMALTQDGGVLYHTDSGTATISRYAYNRATGALSHGETFATVPKTPGEGVPDGMTTDADGNIWSARWGGGCVVCYNGETAQEIARVSLPDVSQVSSVTFGGHDLADMYVTTAGGHQKDGQGRNAGALFRVTVPGVRGVPDFVSRVQVSP